MFRHRVVTASLQSRPRSSCLLPMLMHDLLAAFPRAAGVCGPIRLPQALQLRLPPPQSSAR
jgi:hypothetical protein